MKLKLEGKHHPYCEETWELYINQSQWTCICNILKAYDKWRREKK